jgi:hypothetical protein
MIKVRCKECGARFRIKNQDDFYTKVVGCEKRNCPQQQMLTVQWVKEDAPKAEPHETEMILSSPPSMFGRIDRRVIAK